MSNLVIDAQTLNDMIEIAGDILSEQTEYVNSLNVFPVPDGDTGTNMNLSFQAGLERQRQVKEKTVEAVAEGFAKGLLMGARGNSGVILSQLFRGFSKGCQGHETLDAKTLAHCFENGVETAYKAVMKPVEGTILTVAREAAEAGVSAARENDDVIEVMQAINQSAEKALANTPNQLPILKEVGVVDSGGQGLSYIYNGFLEGLTGEKVPVKTEAVESIDVRELAHEENYYNTSHAISSDEIENGYCTQMMIKIGEGKTVKEAFNYDTFREHLDQMGDSLIVVNDDEIIKTHIHAEYPGEILSYGQKYGSLLTVKVDNMREQHDEILDNQGKAKNKEKQPKIKFGIIAVAAGEGVEELFISSGVTKIISGGQTMNPSTEDILNTINEMNAENIIILPNNKNIYMAAKQAAEVATLPAVVIPTTTISQGLTALLGFNENHTLKENETAMNNEMENVKSGQVTYAVRDTKIDGLTISKGDFMGLIENKIKIANPDKQDTTIKTIKAMIDDDSEIITLIYGEDTTEVEANQIAEAIEKEYSDIDVEIYKGNQPVYAYLISVE